MSGFYDRRSGRVEAVQVESDLESSLDRVRDFVPRDWQAYIRFSDYQDVHYIRVKRPDGSSFSLREGAWLVRDEDGIARWPDALFARAHCQEA